VPIAYDASDVRRWGWHALSRRGLGRGLAAILSDSTGGSADPDGGLHGVLVDAVLDTVSARQPLHLCGYVHEPDTGEPRVRLRAPAVGSLHPTQAYQLFSALHDIAGASAGTHRLDLPGTNAWAVVTTLDERRGIWFFGDPALEPGQVGELARFCGAFAPAVMEHEREPASGERPHLHVDHSFDTAAAEVDVGGIVGFSTAPSPRTAVAQAALALCDPSCKLVRLDPVHAARADAALVVAHGPDGRIGVGAAPVTDDALAAVAVAAYRVGRRLTAPPAS
jgi:hypothetical protein